ncbi:hypothetical protein CLIB1444_02S15940 [[Candida] jaroonii]|uniref:Uncharacterized protein n=1 Tax=[Candida] jaroonii TaxID=467808 RepID=A0ACA9Y540_9ASCO|nr:hypothetical protein CLIB1444_02S15940 [[Candida] jaroonii]
MNVSDFIDSNDFAIEFDDIETNYVYQEKAHSSSFSLPDKLNLLSLNLNNYSSPSTKSPSPEFLNYKKLDENMTINPQDLMSKDDYVLPSSISSPNLTSLNIKSSIFDQTVPPVPSLPPYSGPELINSMGQDLFEPITHNKPFKKKRSMSSTLSKVNLDMNNECVNAINSWINDSNESNPTGIFRRNSSPAQIPKVVPLLYGGIDKRRRRKSHSIKPEEVEEIIENEEVEKPQEVKEVQKIEVVDSVPFHNGRVLKNQPIVIPPQEEGKPFTCPDCPKQFKRSEHLKRHIRSVHSNVRPFHCKYCEKQFSRSDNLAQHLKTHYRINANGTTSIIYGNPLIYHKRKKSRDQDFEDVNWKTEITN